MDYLPERRPGRGGPGTTPSSATCRATRSAATTTRCCARGWRNSPSASPSAQAALGYRVFVDSAPVLEKAAGARRRPRLDRQAHEPAQPPRRLVVLPRRDLHRPAAAARRAGQPRIAARCRACIDVCPTQAIVAPVRARCARCISYLTIELRDSIPDEFREAIGNRIYGCDDCQLVCPWNKFAQLSSRARLRARHGLDAPRLVELFAWSEARVPGAHRRQRDPPHRLRVLAAQHRGRARQCAARRRKSSQRCDHAATTASELVREHVRWALAQHVARRPLRCGLDEHPGPRHCTLSISRARPMRPAVSTTRSTILALGSLRVDPPCATSK